MNPVQPGWPQGAGGDGCSWGWPLPNALLMWQSLRSRTYTVSSASSSDVDQVQSISRRILSTSGGITWGVARAEMLDWVFFPCILHVPGADPKLSLQHNFSLLTSLTVGGTRSKITTDFPDMRNWRDAVCGSEALCLVICIFSVSTQE